MAIGAEDIPGLKILTEKLTDWAQAAVAFVPNLFAAIILILVFAAIANVLDRVLRRGLAHYAESETISRLLRTAVRVTIIIAGIFVALGVMRLDRTVTSLLAGAGVIGLAIGFAFQEIAANFFSGVLIMLRKPYRIGHIVQVENYVGVVTEINLRTTNLTTFGGLEVLVPNKDMFTKPVTNYTRVPKRRVDIEVGISYGDDLRKVQRVVCDAVKNISSRLPDHETEFFYTGFGESAINFQVRFWIEYPTQKSFLQSTHEAIIAIKEAFDQNDITIPFPIRTLDFGIKGGERLAVTMKEVASTSRATTPNS